MTIGTNSLKSRMQAAAGWIVAGYGMSQIIRLGSSLVLTRLLAPDVYGVMAVGYLLITALMNLSDLGLAPLAIQSRQGQEPRFLNVVWVVQIARGAVITLLTLLMAGLFAWSAGASMPGSSVYADERIPVIFAVVALFGLVSGFDSTRVFIARRHLALATLTRIELVSQLVSTVFIIVWALVSPSVVALASGWVVGAVVRCVLTHRLLPGPANRFEWDAKVFRDVLHFGKWTLASSSLSFLVTSGDRLLLGLYLDSTAMGHFAIAMVIFGALHAIVSKLIGEAVLPALSEVVRERPEQARGMLYRLRLPIDLVCAGGAGALFMLGPAVIRLLFDPRYEPAGWMLSVLALVLLYTRLNVFDQCLIAQARVRLLAGLNAIRTVALLVAIPLGHHLGGPRGAIIGVAGAAFANAAILLLAQWRAGLFDLRRELLGIPMFVAGLCAGWAVEQALKWIFAW